MCPGCPPGPLPSDWSALSKLTTLSLLNNSLTGERASCTCLLAQSYSRVVKCKGYSSLHCADEEGHAQQAHVDRLHLEKGKCSRNAAGQLVNSAQADIALSRSQPAHRSGHAAPHPSLAQVAASSKSTIAIASCSADKGSVGCRRYPFQLVWHREGHSPSRCQHDVLCVICLCAGQYNECVYGLRYTMSCWST